MEVLGPVDTGRLNAVRLRKIDVGVRLAIDPSCCDGGRLAVVHTWRGSASCSRQPSPLVRLRRWGKRDHPALLEGLDGGVRHLLHVHALGPRDGPRWHACLGIVAGFLAVPLKTLARQQHLNKCVHFPFEGRGEPLRKGVRQARMVHPVLVRKDGRVLAGVADPDVPRRPEHFAPLVVPVRGPAAQKHGDDNACSRVHVSGTSETGHQQRQHSQLDQNHFECTLTHFVPFRVVSMTVAQSWTPTAPSSGSDEVAVAYTVAT